MSKTEMVVSPVGEPESHVERVSCWPVHRETFHVSGAVWLNDPRETEAAELALWGGGGLGGWGDGGEGWLRGYGGGGGGDGGLGLGDGRGGWGGGDDAVCSMRVEPAWHASVKKISSSQRARPALAFRVHLVGVACRSLFLY